MQVQLVGDAGAQVILVIAHQALKGVVAAAWLKASEYVRQIGTDAATAKDSYAEIFQPASRQGGVARILDCFPGALQEKALLRIYCFCLATGIAEKGSIKFVRVL